MEMINFQLSQLEQERIDEELKKEPQHDSIPESWKGFAVMVPPDFYDLMWDTIKKYQQLRETDKVFPALEAIFIEARNSLPV